MRPCQDLPPGGFGARRNCCAFRAETEMNVTKGELVLTFPRIRHETFIIMGKTLHGAANRNVWQLPRRLRCRLATVLVWFWCVRHNGLTLVFTQPRRAALSFSKKTSIFYGYSFVQSELSGK